MNISFFRTTYSDTDADDLPTSECRLLEADDRTGEELLTPNARDSSVCVSVLNHCSAL